MKTRKAELRSIALDIIAEREKTTYRADQQAHLLLGTGEALQRRGQREQNANVICHREPELGHDDKLLALELFWDLIPDRVISSGPFF